MMTVAELKVFNKTAFRNAASFYFLRKLCVINMT